MDQPRRIIREMAVTKRIQVSILGQRMSLHASQVLLPTVIAVIEYNQGLLYQARALGYLVRMQIHRFTIESTTEGS